jgi:hypothetical protein
MQPATPLTFSFSPSNPGTWAPLLGGGIGISTPVGISLKKFLCDQLMIPSDYLEHRIQTILVNSRAVDDEDQVYISHGDVIALSAAMPGLAGATLRRGGHLAPMRAAISQNRTKSAADGHQRGIVVLKLFNLVAKEIGPQILSGEIWLKSRDLAYLRDQNIIGDDPAFEASPEEWIRLQPAAQS